MRHPNRLLVAVGVLMVTASLGLRGQSENFIFAEESFRLPADPSPVATSTTDVDYVDVDADGDLDIFKAEGTDSLEGRPNRLLINNGRGQFSDETHLRLPPDAANSTKADFGDVDGDGDLDAIVANVGPEQLLLNDGRGFFIDASAQLPPPVAILENISADARFADVDADGDLDILISNENPFNPAGGGQNRIFLNDSSGRFLDVTADRLPAAIDQTAAMLPGDIDSDGDLDIVVLNRGQESILINNGDGFFADETARRFPVTRDSTRGGAIADLDGDGDLDVVTANSRTQPVAIYFNENGIFTAGDFGMTPLPGETDTGLEVSDVDHDGDLDVYVTNAGPFVAGHGFLGGPDRYFRNNGRGKFVERTASHFVPPDDPSTDAAFGDIDGDGDLDLVIGNSGDGGGERIFVNYPCARDRCVSRVE